MEHVRIKRISEKEGQTVRIKGWLYNKRGKGKLIFLQLRDGSGEIQGVAFKDNLTEETFALCDALPQESAVEVTGTARADARSACGYEIDVTAVRLLQGGEGYPIAKKEHGPDFLLGNRHLWLRSRRQVAVLRVRDRAVRAIREFFAERDFINVDAPIFTPNACEGTTTLFEVNYFEDEKAYLSQSGQLYMEAAAMAHGRAYCFGPVFRAEKSKTRKHLTEFWMVEPEAAFFELDDVMALAEEFVAHIVRQTLEHCSDDLKTLDRDLDKLRPCTETPYPRISYDEAVKRIEAAGETIAWGEDFGAPHETALSAGFDRPVLVHRFPAQVKAFYMKGDPADPRLALCVDAIAPEGYGEIIGGGQREDSLEVLEGKIAEHQLPRQAFEWFLDLRRYGSVPHGGFGLGLERTVAWLCGIEHVREAAPFPRLLHRIYP